MIFVILLLKFLPTNAYMASRMVTSYDANNNPVYGDYIWVMPGNEGKKYIGYSYGSSWVEQDGKYVSVPPLSDISIAAILKAYGYEKEDEWETHNGVSGYYLSITFVDISQMPELTPPANPTAPTPPNPKPSPIIPAIVAGLLGVGGIFFLIANKKKKKEETVEVAETVAINLPETENNNTGM